MFIPNYTILQLNANSLDLEQSMTFLHFQVLYQLLIHERCIRSRVDEFVDLCSFANVSYAADFSLHLNVSHLALENGDELGKPVTHERPKRVYTNDFLLTHEEA